MDAKIKLTATADFKTFCKALNQTIKLFNHSESCHDLPIPATLMSLRAFAFVPQAFESIKEWSRGFENDSFLAKTFIITTGTESARNRVVSKYCSFLWSSGVVQIYFQCVSRLFPSKVQPPSLKFQSDTLRHREMRIWNVWKPHDLFFLLSSLRKDFFCKFTLQKM